MTALAVLASAFAPAAALAQYTSPPPLYPYELQPGQPYAVQVAPNTYVIHRPHDYPYVRPAAAPKKFDRPVRRNDPRLIEELRQRSAKRSPKAGVTRDVINTTKIVRGPPVVIERRRVVEHPPRVIERYVHEDGTPVSPPVARRGNVQIEPQGVIPRGGAKRGSKDDKRVIQADAEVTILGPDRMSIRLFRKGGGPNASVPGE